MPGPFWFRQLKAGYGIRSRARAVRRIDRFRPSRREAGLTLVCSHKKFLHNIGLMKAFSVRELKNNPSVALRAAREDPVMVLNRHKPQALLVHLDDDTLLSEPGIRRALATALYRDQSLSLGHAAQFAGVAIGDFVSHLSQAGIPVIRGTAASVHEDTEVITAWRKGSSQQTPAP